MVEEDLLESRTMETIIDYLCTAYNLTVSDNHLLINNEKELAKKQKLNRLEEKRILEEENMKLKIKTSSKMTPEHALNFLNMFIDFDNTSFEYKKNLINSMVKAVTVYNDKIVVELNEEDLSISCLIDDTQKNDVHSTTSPSCPPLKYGIRNI